MEPYVFAVHFGQIEIVREEVLAVTEEAAIDVAAIAIDGISEPWTTATLTDEEDRIVWTVANAILAPRSGDTEPTK